MANITVSVPLSNITVNTTSNVVNVSTSLSNVVVSELSQANTAAVRQALSVTDTGGDGSLSYSNTTGVFTYTGPSAAEVRAHLSGTSPITYSSGTGAIGINSNAVLTGSTTDDLAEGTTNKYFTTSGATVNTDALPEGSTNLYFTSAAANTAITDFDGVLTPSSLTATGNIEGAVLKGTGTLGLVVSGNATIGGNLDVTGNINSETVVDLLVEDRNITLQYGLVGTPTANAHLFIDRGSEANVAMFWDETNNRFKINNSDYSNTTFDLGLIGEAANSIVQIAGTGANAITDTSFIQLNEQSESGNAGLLFNKIASGQTGQGYAIFDQALGTGAGSKFEFGWANVNSSAERADGTALSIYTARGSNVTTLGSVEVHRGNLNLSASHGTDPGRGFVNGNGAIFANTVTAGNLITSGESNATTVNATTGNITTVNATDVNTTNVNVSVITGLSTLTASGNIGADTFEGNLFVGNSGTVTTENNVAATFGDGDFTVGSTGDPSSNITLFGELNLDKGNLTTGVQDADINYRNISFSGNIDSNTRITTTGNVDGANVNATHLHGEGSNITGLTTSIVSEGTNLYYTNARANAAFVDSLDNITTAISSNSNITTTATVQGANVIATANVTADTVLTDKIESGASANLNLKGQADGIHFDTTIDSTESRIVDLDTTGYSVADVTTPADFTEGTSTPSAIVSVNLTAGSPTVSVNDIFAGGLGFAGLQVAALRGPGFSTATGGGSTGPICAPTTGGFANVLHAFTTAGTALSVPAFGLDIRQNGLANATAGLYGQDKGWTAFDVTTSSSTTLFPANAYVTGMTAGTITFSENALITATGRTVVLSPSMAQTSDNKTIVKYYANTHTGSNSEFISNYGRLSNFDNPETLSNTTFDAISYGNTSSVTTTVTMKNISDFAGADESATRFKRALLIGAATTPDPVSGRSTLNDPSTLGVILESDGESYNDGLNTPAPRFLINNYSGGMDELTNYPVWGQVGATGNLTLDLPQLKAPSLTLKSFRGAKSTANTTSYLMQAGDVVGKIAFSPAQTTGTGNQGVDSINPPAAITVDVGSANINTGVANAYMHITTTPYSGTNLGYSRNNANADSGANQQTNFTTKDGNLTLAAQTDGMITLAPTPDYGDAANSTVWTRYPGSTHEYHSFLDAKFLGSRAGTLVEIQPKSGTTTGSGGLAYDSKGNATLRLSTHEANSDVKKQWDITNDQSSGNLVIRDHTNSTNVIHFDGSRVFIDETLKLQNLTTTEINAIASPESGDMVYNTTLNQVCFYNGSAWQKITSATM